VIERSVFGLHVIKMTLQLYNNVLYWPEQTYEMGIMREENNIERSREGIFAIAARIYTLEFHL